MNSNEKTPCSNQETTYIWAVSKSGIFPVTKYKVVKETVKTFILENDAIVRKATMESCYQLFFMDEESANVVDSKRRNARC